MSGAPAAAILATAILGAAILADGPRQTYGGIALISGIGSTSSDILAAPEHQAAGAPRFLSRP